MAWIEPARPLWMLPVLYAAAAVWTVLAASRASAWRGVEALSAIGAIAVTTLGIIEAGPSLAGRPGPDPVGCVMCVLVGVLGWVIVRYSRNYLEGEPGQKRYVLALMLVLTAVAVTVLSHNLAIVLVAWAASSLALHKLLTFYARRPGALLAAHKKFIVSRLAELCIVGALILFHLHGHALSLNRIDGLAGTPMAGGWMLQGAMFLVATAVVLKAAQLPFHGWLIQVMEAPTPVSALLHAGVVNIGGFILIRLAPLLADAAAARALLVAAGTATATLAGLAMMTRVDIKTRLAWSTCAQMGFMLLECGLGLFALAFLHLVAHSLYKAYGFLSSGETVERATGASLLRPIEPHPRTREALLRLLSAPVAIAIAAALAGLSESAIPGMHVPWVAAVIVGLAGAPFFWIGAPRVARKLLLAAAMQAAVVLVYLFWHRLFTRLVDIAPVSPAPAAAGFVGAAFALMYVLQVLALAYPQAAAIGRIRAWAYAGFYLDEAFSRITQKVWPLRNTLRTTSALAFRIGKSAAGNCE